MTRRELISAIATEITDHRRSKLPDPVLADLIVERFDVFLRETGGRILVEQVYEEEPDWSQ